MKYNEIGTEIIEDTEWRDPKTLGSAYMLFDVLFTNGLEKKYLSTKFYHITFEELEIAKKIILNHVENCKLTGNPGTIRVADGILDISAIASVVVSTKFELNY